MHNYNRQYTPLEYIESPVEFMSTLKKHHRGVDFYAKTINEEIQNRATILKCLAQDPSFCFYHTLDHASNSAEFISNINDDIYLIDDNNAEKLADTLDRSQESGHYIYYWYQNEKRKKHITQDTKVKEIRLFLIKEANKLSKSIA